MKVNFKCFAKLSEGSACDHSNSKPVDLNSGNTVRDLAQTTGIAPDDIKIVFVNGRMADLSTSLNDGDNVALAPASGGM